MSAPAGIGESSSYFSRFFALVRLSLTQLVRPPSQPQRGAAARKLAQQLLLLTAIGGAVVVALMFAFDVTEIGLMPRRGTPSLWPVRIVTNFGEAAFVLGALAGLLLAVAIIAPRLREDWRSLLLSFGMRLQFLFFAVLVPVLAGEVIKWIVGRGRPFVGGKANAFNFVHFPGSEAYASFPSAHAVTSFALAFAVSAIWPRTRVAMSIYAVSIALSRLVLLAHHPSDVVAGALIGVAGAMVVRYWFAARRLGFTIRRGGMIAPLTGAALGRLKRVAREASAP